MLRRVQEGHQDQMVWMDLGDPKESPEPPVTMATLATMAFRVIRVTPDRPEIPERRETREFRATPGPLAPQVPKALMANQGFPEAQENLAELDKMAVLDHEDLMAFLA